MIKKMLVAICVIVIGVGLYGYFKTSPDGVNHAGEIYSVPASSVHFFQDVTYVDGQGERHSEQEIFDEVFRMIDEAESYVLVDFFLYNDFLGAATSSHRQLSHELTDALITKKQDDPDVTIQVITDPINEFYNGVELSQFERLEKHGVSVITTDLTELPDSNPLYSAFWRSFFQWFRPYTNGGYLPNPLHSGGEKVGALSYLSVLNFKANHRKVVMTDYARNGNRGFSTLLTSANPHDGSSAHSNTAIRVDDYLWKDVLATEAAVARFSGVPFAMPSDTVLTQAEDKEGEVRVQLLTEEAIRNAVLEMINELESGDALDMAMFYLADRKVVRALKRADTRGVQMRILLDPSKDAFGRIKNGLPNRQVASELMMHTEGNTRIRWCDTHGEQCHSKFVLTESDSAYKLLLGSANLTKRNIGNFNLETDVLIESDTEIPAIAEASEFFERRWGNTDGNIHSTEYSTYQDDSVIKKLRYRVQEFLGTNRW